MSIGRYLKIKISGNTPIDNQLSFEFEGRQNLDDMLEIIFALATKTPP
jgi:hypothetical protein